MIAKELYAISHPSLLAVSHGSLTCLARSCLFLRNQLSRFLKSGSFWMTSSSRVRQAKRGMSPTIERTFIAMLCPGSLQQVKEG